MFFWKTAKNSCNTGGAGLIKLNLLFDQPCELVCAERIWWVEQIKTSVERGPQGASSFGGAFQPEQTLTDDNLNKYPVSKNEQVDYSYLANNRASKLQSQRYAIPSRDLTSKRVSIVSAYAGYEPPPINLSLSKS